MEQVQAPLETQPPSQLQSELKAKESAPKGAELKEEAFTAVQLQKIAKQEKFLSAERQKLAEANRELESLKKEAEMYKSLKSKDPFDILEHFDVSYDKLVEADQRRRTPVDPVAKKALETVEQLRRELSSKETEAQQERLSRAEVKLMSTIDTAIKEQEYDLIEMTGSQSAVRDFMEEMYSQTGEIPDVKEACEAITQHLVDMYSKVKDSKWLKPKGEVKVEVKAEMPKLARPASLSNKMVQSSVSAPTPPMTDADRTAAAIAMVRQLRKKA